MAAQSGWPALVINLAQRTDRWAHVTANLATHARGFIQDVRRVEAQYDASDGCRGCLVSFARALETAWECQWPEFFILEDDVVFDATSEMRWRTAFATLPADWQLVAGSASWVDAITVSAASPLALRIFRFTGSHCVLYRRDCVPDLRHTIRALLADNQVVPYDHVLNVAVRHKYLVVPFVAYVQPGDRSDIRRSDPTSRVDLEKHVLPTERRAVLELARVRTRPLSADVLAQRLAQYYVQVYQPYWKYTPTGLPPPMGTEIKADGWVLQQVGV